MSLHAYAAFLAFCLPYPRSFFLAFLLVCLTCLLILCHVTFLSLPTWNIPTCPNEINGLMFGKHKCVSEAVKQLVRKEIQTCHCSSMLPDTAWLMKLGEKNTVVRLFLSFKVIFLDSTLEMDDRSKLILAKRKWIFEPRNRRKRAAPVNSLSH